MMNILKSTKLVAFITSLSLTTGCLDDGHRDYNNENLAIEVMDDVTADFVCEDCTEGADEAAADLAAEVAAWLAELDEDLETVDEGGGSDLGELALAPIDPIKICKTIADVKKAVDALRKARKAYKLWKTTTGLGKCAKAGLAIAEIAAAIALVGGAIQYFTKKGDCMSPAEKQMLEDLKKGLDELNKRAADAELKKSAEQCPAPQPGTGGTVSK
ncbi:MAG: hypothetical protein ACKV2T_18365 [Kofleriaceae bacterium]